MLELLLPPLFVVVAWWGGTGLVLYLDGMRRETVWWTLGGATVLALLSLYGLRESAGSLSPESALLAFICALAVWAWQELAFLTGVLTGSWRQPCPPHLAFWPRFRLAARAILHHEIGILCSAMLVAAVTWGGENQVGTWTFLILWIMRLSAKLNIFLGVRNLNAEFLPDHLRYLGSFFVQKPMNWLLPVPITVGSMIAALLFAEAMAPGTASGRGVACMLLGTLLALAVFEHWMLVLPVPAAVIWAWGFRSRSAPQPVDIIVLSGFPGAGRRTVAGRMLGEGTALLSAAPGAAPAWPASGGLGEDVSDDVRQAVAAWKPARLLLLPHDFVDGAVLRQALGRPEMRGTVAAVRTLFVVDAENFSRDHPRLPEWFAREASAADEIIVNRVDVAARGTLDATVSALRSMAPSAAISLRVQGECLADAAWTSALAPACDRRGLEALLHDIAGGAFGEVDRLEGIARAGQDWVEFFVAGGRPAMASFAPLGNEQPRVTAFGRRVDGGRLSAAFAACAVRAVA